MQMLQNKDAQRPRIEPLAGRKNVSPMAWIELGDSTAVGDLGFGDTCCSSVFSFDLSFASFLESCVCGVLCISGAERLCVELRMLCLRVYISSVQWRRALVSRGELRYWEDDLV